MSDINGQGYGDVHEWEAKDQPYGQRWTEYNCTVCKDHFRHYYNEIPDIFEAMRHCGVKETCV